VYFKQGEKADKLVSELDALGLDDDPIGEGETPSYLQDSQALPDFVDMAPIEESAVSHVMEVLPARLMICSIRMPQQQRSRGRGQIVVGVMRVMDKKRYKMICVRLC
jgi:hypothetical protein